MRIFILSLFCFLLFSRFSCVFADEAPVSNSNCNIRPKQQLNTVYGENEEQVWNSEEIQNIEENYGSEKSPYYNNRNNNTTTDDTDTFVDPYDFEE